METSHSFPSRCTTRHLLSAINLRGLLLLVLTTQALALSNSNVTDQRALSRTVSGSNVATVAAGLAHSCALTPDGGVSCWGSNGNGQLGTGTLEPSPAPVAVASLAGIAEVSAASRSTCVRDLGGAISCWGFNDFGTLGNGNFTGSTLPVPTLPMGTATSVVAGEHHVCALIDDGSVRCWGLNHAGQLGNGSTDNNPAPVAVPNLSDVQTIAAGLAHSCVTISGGTVWCWGANNVGQLGDGSTTPSLVPVQVNGLQDVVSLSLHLNASCATLTSGELRCWGATGAGSFPVPTLIDGFQNSQTVDAGSFFACAGTATGSVQCFGANDNGQLGDGSFTQTTVAVDVVGLTGITELAAGGSHVCARANTLADMEVYCWGRNAEGQIGNGQSAASDEPVDVFGLPQPSSLSAGGLSVCAAMESSMVCWGSNSFGQIGDGTQINRARPASVQGISDPLAIANGSSHSCVVRQDRTAACWGNGADGRLGNGSNAASSIPTAVLQISDLALVTAGSRHSCASTTEGAVYCWGFSFGSTPVQVGSFGGTPDTAIVALSAGSFHTCGVQADGAIWCWGSNESGQLGNGSMVASTVPVQVLTISDASAVSSQLSFSCAIVAGGEIRCWGSNTFGQLGDGTTTNSATPVTVIGSSEAVAVGLGQSRFCAAISDGSVRCWGAFVEPWSVQSGLADVSELHGHLDGMCFSAATPGGVKCIGGGGFGQLGTGALGHRPTPQRVIFGDQPVSGLHFAVERVNGSSPATPRGPSSQLYRVELINLGPSAANNTMIEISPGPSASIGDWTCQIPDGLCAPASGTGPILAVANIAAGDIAVLELALFSNPDDPAGLVLEASLPEGSASSVGSGASSTITLPPASFVFSDSFE